MSTNTRANTQAAAPAEPLTRPHPWTKPRFSELRFGFEVTMYSEYR